MIGDGERDKTPEEVEAEAAGDEGPTAESEQPTETEFQPTPDPEDFLTEAEKALPIPEVVRRIREHIKDKEGNLYETGGSLRQALRLLFIIAPLEAKRLTERSGIIQFIEKGMGGGDKRAQRDIEVSLLKADVLRVLDNIPAYLLEEADSDIQH